MTEEEKEILKRIDDIFERNENYKYPPVYLSYDITCIKGLLDLYNKEKEKNKIAVAMLTKGIYPSENSEDNDFDANFISKDVIRKNKKKLEQKRKVALRSSNIQLANALLFGINELNKLLEGTNEQ